MDLPLQLPCVFMISLRLAKLQAAGKSKLLAKQLAGKQLAGKRLGLNLAKVFLSTSSSVLENYAIITDMHWQASTCVHTVSKLMLPNNLLANNLLANVSDSTWQKCSFQLQVLQVQC
jgi:hypothetical protein